MIEPEEPATILIVDDEPENLNVLEEMLRQHGWTVYAVPRGDLGLIAAREHLPDLLLLDVRMPGMDGYEVCRRFKADDRLADIPIIFLSAFSDTEDKVKAFESGGLDFVTKPFAEIEVIARTRTHLRLRRYQLHLQELVRQRMGELTEAHRRLRIWDDAKTQWLNFLSHEMRTPLTGVFGIAEILFMHLDENSSFQDLRRDYETSRGRIEKLIDDATTISQLNVAAEQFQVNPVLLSTVIREALRLAAEQSSPIPIQVASQAADYIVVKGNLDLLVRAMLNLLQTADHCLSEGEQLRMDIACEGSEATITISTRGQHLPQEALETFFDVGGQRMLLTEGGDFGLSPALASRIIRLLGGRLSVRNGHNGLILELVMPATLHNAPPLEESHD